MAKRFTVDRSELGAVKDWLTKQIRGGRIPLRLAAIDHVFDAADAQRLIEDLDSDARKRLQLALAARRSRAKKKSQVSTQLDLEARDMLLKVAHARNMTTSELLISLLEEEYLRLA